MAIKPITHTKAILRGYVEIDEGSAQSLAKAGFPIETRFFIPKIGDKAQGLRTLKNMNGTLRTRHDLQPRAPGNTFISMGDEATLKSNIPDTALSHRQVAVTAKEILKLADNGVMRRPEFRKVIAKRLKKDPSSISPCITKLVRIGYLIDHGKTPPEILGTKVAAKK